MLPLVVNGGNQDPTGLLPLNYGTLSPKHYIPLYRDEIKQQLRIVRKWYLCFEWILNIVETDQMLAYAQNVSKQVARWFPDTQ